MKNKNNIKDKNSRPMPAPYIKKKDIWIAIILVAVLGIGVYANSLKGQFIWDDDNLIRNNAYIRTWSGIPSIFTKTITAGAGRIYSFYRPVQLITYMMDYSLWKFDPAGYHLTNILLHVAAALVLLWLLNLLFKDFLLSLFASALFVVNPLNTEVVSYISGRADSLGALFMFLCFVFYIKQSRSKAIDLFLVFITYMLAVLSRENSLILPVLLLLYHYAFKRRIYMKKFLTISAVTVLYLLIRVTMLRYLYANAPLPPPLIQRIPGFFAAITGYFRLLLLPVGLHMEYGSRLFSVSDPAVWLGAFILSLLAIYSLKKRNSGGLVFFSILWFIITLLPQSNIYPVNAYMAEHWLYLPAIGFFLILAKILTSLRGLKGYEKTAGILFISILVFYSYLTIVQNRYWKDPVSFYEGTLKYVPDSERICNNLAAVYNDEGKYDRALILAQRAVKLDEDYANAYNSLGVIYRNMGRNGEAMGTFKKAVEKDPRFGEAYNNLGMVYYNSGKIEEAIASFKKAVETKPDLFEAYNNLGVVYTRIGKNSEALELFNKVIRFSPGYADAYNNLGNVYSNLGQKDQAVIFYKRAVEIAPNNGTAYYNLAIEYQGKRQYDLALQYCDKAIQLGVKVPPGFIKLIEPYRK